LNACRTVDNGMGHRSNSHKFTVEELLTIVNGRLAAAGSRQEGREGGGSSRSFGGRVRSSPEREPEQEGGEEGATDGKPVTVAHIDG